MSPPLELSLLRFRRQAMATEFEIAMPLGTPNAPQAAKDALDIVDQLEAQLTVFRENSEVSRINRHAALGPLQVEPRLFALLQLAQRIHQGTNGAFDIATGALIKAWRSSRDTGTVPELSNRDSGAGTIGDVQLDPQQRTIHLLKPGVEINLGSIGKGYALDRAAEQMMTRWNIHQTLLHGGSSSVLGVGAQPGQSRGWPVGLGHPRDLNRRIGVAWLRDRALGTSAATFQNVASQGRMLGHILDPRTGCPAEEVLSASAVAPTAAEADALATAFFVLGVERTRVYCEEHPEVGAVVLAPGEDVPIVLGNVDFACIGVS